MKILKMLTVLSIFLAAFIGSSSADEQCGHNVSNALCPNNLCCSQWGYCGINSPWCGEGCQSQCQGPVQCGLEAGNATCPGELCCSKWGFCGDTGDYCWRTEGCQSNCHSQIEVRCGRAAGGALCPHGLCCSNAGYCGSSNSYCGSGCQSQCTSEVRCGLQAGGRVCPDGQCCSKLGFCGNTNDHCGVGCQSLCKGSHVLSQLSDAKQVVDIGKNESEI